MVVRISNVVTTRKGGRSETFRNEYVARSREECRDNVDRSVYDLVVQFGDTITMGQVIDTPA